MEENAAKSNFECIFCKKTFSRIFNLKRHVKNIHALAYSIFKREILKEGRRKMKKEEEIFKEFIDFSEFLIWKEQQERETSAMYVRQRGNAIRKNGDKILHYYCNRSGVYKPRGKGLKRLKSQGSAKIGASCPARMIVKITSENVTVHFFRKHENHELDVKHLRLPQCEKEAIADISTMATKWGVVSAGKISHDFVTAVRSIYGNDHEIVAVAARDINSAKKFASTHEIHKSYGSYEELAKDPDVEVVYIGTIITQHFPVGKLMLENGKHVLMEKPMTLNLKQTKELIEIARANKRFLMEAVWSRFLPSYVYLRGQLKNKRIGDVTHVSSCFGFSLLEVERLVKKSFGGGTILDLGIYTLNAVSTVYNGEKPEKIAAVGHLNEDGVDIAVACSLSFSKNRTAQVTTSAVANLPNDLVITGTKGYAKIPQMWCPTTMEINGKNYDFPLPDTVLPCNFINSSGLRYEAMEVRDCIKKGALESSIMPLKDSEKLAEIMDEIRRQLGVVFDED